MATAAAKVLQATAVVAENDGSEDFGNYGDSGCEAGEVTAVVGGSDDPGRETGGDRNDGSQDFGNYGDSGCEAGEVTAVVGGSDDPGRETGSDSGCNHRGDSDNPGRDDCGDEAMVPTSAANSSDSVVDVFKGTTVVEADAMVRKMATAAAKVLQATAVVAVTVTIQDATREVMVPKTSAITATAAVKFLTAPAGNNGSQDFGNNGDSGCEAGEVTAVVGGSDDPGRDEGSDAALEAMTVVIVVTTVVDAAAIRSAYSKEAKTSAITATAATFLTATAGVSAVAITPDSTRDAIVPKTVAITTTAAAKFLTVAAVTKNGTNNGDHGGGVSYDNDRGGCSDAEDCDSGGKVFFTVAAVVAAGVEGLEATAEVAATTIIQDATRAAMSPRW
ncbi:hypothetical protein Bbelb_021060 [Branchiostoma belcheri]|nr:hypothetical protein Bbelb_021060 [Branchiostoma belcheri]